MAVEATSLPRLTSPERLDRRPRYFTPNAVHLQGLVTHRDPIIGTFKPAFSRSRSTLLPDIYQRNFNKNVRYEPRHIKVLDASGKVVSLKTKTQEPKDIPEQKLEKLDLRLQRSLSNMHERSVFEDTCYGSSYYIIHPDWTSELHGRHMLSSRTRATCSYENRPAVHPLSSYIDPLLEKRRKRDEYIKAMEQAKQINERQTVSRQATQVRLLKPQTPRDSQGRYKSFTSY